MRAVSEPDPPDETVRPLHPVLTGGTGLWPGVDISSNSATCALLDEGLPLAELH